MSPKRILIVIGFIIVLVYIPFFPFALRVAYALIHGGALQLLGYPVDIPPWELAEEMVQSGKDPSYCFKLQQSVPVEGPTIESRRTNCVFEYAKMKKDSTACQLLMPSAYGLDCIGSVWGPLIDESNCHWYKTNSIRCFEGKALIPHIINCEDPAQKNLPDECKHRLAFKKKDPNLCDSITNEALRSVCRVSIQTWNSYPELRSTIYFNDNTQ